MGAVVASSRHHDEFDVSTRRNTTRNKSRSMQRALSDLGCPGPCQISDNVLAILPMRDRPRQRTVRFQEKSKEVVYGRKEAPVFILTRASSADIFDCGRSSGQEKPPPSM
mmetsp:Transcript_57592/g.151589  ORF Transcript_57592/g.151589 Transcript_57592/m.151589 type:complete len:110 (-) Transcript_57592:43-372(-)